MNIPQSKMKAMFWTAAATVLLPAPTAAISAGCCETMTAVTGGVWANFSQYIR